VAPTMQFIAAEHIKKIDKVRYHPKQKDNDSN